MTAIMPYPDPYLTRNTRLLIAAYYARLSAFLRCAQRAPIEHLQAGGIEPQFVTLREWEAMP